jgi:hypothetical protein
LSTSPHRPAAVSAAAGRRSRRLSCHTRHEMAADLRAIRSGTAVSRLFFPRRPPPTRRRAAFRGDAHHLERGRNSQVLRAHGRAARCIGSAVNTFLSVFHRPRDFGDWAFREAVVGATDGPTTTCEWSWHTCRPNLARITSSSLTSQYELGVVQFPIEPAGRVKGGCETADGILPPVPRPAASIFSDCCCYYSSLY